ncbi:choice-of-anchor B family protein [Alteromonas sp. ASW11-130]|uniref:choice-of-anchor B family protein n=1 Tax=Alteromonas sp. ASW11-130 TaxID=3015775 RepID=UPI002241D9F0|nr:choice-of-anchor B family protein [Alteromonas sp. ASW11-130]MCW8092793.1 choice-of-anchor B family protein [Alteromonas sp. ASW11-130]
MNTLKMKPYLCCLIVVLSITFSQEINAHSEGETVRFVAPNGSDTGNCNNRFRPCKTISYAASYANKGDSIRVSKGYYAIEDEQTLFHLVGELVPVLGGFNQADHYQIQNPSAYDTVLAGVPVEFAKQLSNQGFNVIADGKNSIASSVSKQITQTITQLATRHGAADCIDGLAANFSCRNVALIAHVPISELHADSSSANDIWGHVDLNTMREYAIMGLRNGVVVVDVSTPDSPQVVGSISGAPTTWRDIKVYQYFNRATHSWQAYAYVSADNADEGLRIINLNQLPDSISEIAPLQDDVRAHNIYISHTDPGLNISLPGSSSQLHVAGSENFNGAWRSFMLTSPDKPSVAYNPETATRTDYSHDIAGFFVTDGRAQEDCKGDSSISCSVILDFNEQSVRLWDTSNPKVPWEVSEITYPNITYTHSGWTSEDNRYLFVHDEGDESSLSVNTAVNVFDISDLTMPTLVTTWEGSTRAIDHNGFAKGNRYYMSNYERGLTILDISDPTAPEEIGYFDTFPSSNNASFNGAWGVYPFLPSGIILVSDIQGGLYILRDDTTASSDTQVRFTAPTLTVQPGESARIPVQREGSSNIDVEYRIIYGSADNTDITASNGILTWNAPEDPDQIIDISINQNDDTEFTESFFIKLVNPSTGNVDHTAGLLAVHIDSARGNQGVANFTHERFEVAENISLYNINVSRVGGTQGTLRVAFEVSAGTAGAEDFEPQTGELVWENGDNQDKAISITLYDDEIDEQAETVIITLIGTDENGVGDMSSSILTIKDDETNQPPQVNAGPDQTVSVGARVQLNASASDPEKDNLTYAWQQTEGAAVTLSSSNSLNASFTAPQSATTITMSLTATDELGVSATDSVRITVNDSNDTGGDNDDSGSDEGTDTDSGSSGGGGSLGAALLLLLLSQLLIKHYAAHYQCQDNPKENE